MVCAIGKPLRDFWEELTDKFGVYEMAEDNLRFSNDDKERIENILVKEKTIPDFNGVKPIKVGYEDGVKFYFEDNSFVICRFSGTEQLLRIFAEGKNKAQAMELIACVKKAVF
jgi:phosphomannomutase